MSGAVGSTPRYTRSGSPVFAELSSFCFSSSSGMTSAAPFLRYSSCSSTGLNLCWVISSHFAQKNPPPGNLIFSFEDNLHRLAVDAVFFLQDALGKGVLIVAIEHWNHRLKDDRPRIEILIDEMHGASRELHAVLERLSLRLEPGKSRQERRVYIQNPLWEGRHKIRR